MSEFDKVRDRNADFRKTLKGKGHIGDIKEKSKKVNPIVLESKHNNFIGNLAKQLVKAKKSIHSNITNIYGDFNDIIIRVDKDSTLLSIVYDYELLSYIKSIRHELPTIDRANEKDVNSIAFLGEPKQHISNFTKKLMTAKATNFLKMPNIYGLINGTILRVNNVSSFESILEDFHSQMEIAHEKFVNSYEYRMRNTRYNYYSQQ